MKIPHTINANYFKEYAPSQAALQMLADANRNIKSENATWDELHPPRLNELCVMAIAANFEKRVILNELPCWDKNYLLEILSTDLPLPLVVQHINEEIYWKRKVKDRWKDGANYVQDCGFDWKRMYLERHVEETVESMTPEGFDINQVTQLCSLARDYVKRLNLRQLQIVQGSVTGDEDADVYNTAPPPCDHINLSPIISGLANLVELHVQFGLRNVGANYKKSDFSFSVQDCRNLGAGVAKSITLKLLRVHSCNLDDSKLIGLLSSMEENTSIETLDFSNCKIGDDGAIAIAKYIKNRKNIKKIILTNNMIGVEGVAALAFMMTQQNSCPIEYLDVKFNLIGDEGLNFFASALIRAHTKLETLIVACCGLQEESAVYIGEMLNRNTLIRNIDLSNNKLGEAGGRALETAMSNNKTLQFMDLRMTGIKDEQYFSIKRALHFNRIRALKGERGVEKEYRNLAKKVEEAELKLEEEAKEQAWDALEAERLTEMVEEETETEEDKGN